MCAHSPPRAEASLCPRKAGQRKKESARGTMGRVKRGSESSFPPFLSSHSPPRAYCFFPSSTPIFIGIPRGFLCGGERSVCASPPWVPWASVRSVLFSTDVPANNPRIEETKQLNAMNFKLLSNLILLYTKALASLYLSHKLTAFFL